MKFPTKSTPANRLNRSFTYALLSSGPYNPSQFHTQHSLLKLLFEPERAREWLSRKETGTTLSPPVDWKLFLERAHQEGVAPILHWQITKHALKEEIPDKIRGILAEDYLRQLKANLTIIGELRKILGSFRQAGLSCILLKGMDLAERIYPSLAMRGMSDVDLLIKKEDLVTVDGLMSAEGYQSIDSSAAESLKNPIGYLASLDYRKEHSSLNLHLHWHTINSSVPAQAVVEWLDVNRLWEKAVPVEVADSQALALCPEHSIIYLCEHALRVGHSFDRLILVCDIFFSIKACEGSLRWDFLVEESRRFHLDCWLYISLVIVNAYSRLMLPEEVLAELKPAKLSLGERIFLDLQLQNRRSRGSSYLLYLAMNRGLGKKLRFIARTLFPPAQILMQRQYGKKTRPRVAYYLSHLWEAVYYFYRLIGR